MDVREAEVGEGGEGVGGGGDRLNELRSRFRRNLRMIGRQGTGLGLSFQIFVRGKERQLQELRLPFRFLRVLEGKLRKGQLREGQVGQVEVPGCGFRRLELLCIFWAIWMRP